MNALVTVNHGTLSRTLQDSGLLRALEHVRIDRPAFGEFPLVSAEERSAIPGMIAALEKSLAGSTADQVDAVLGMLSYALPRRQAVEDQAAMLAVYEKALADIPPDVLDVAGIEAVKTLKFFPRVVELRELAQPEISRRRWMIIALKRLAERFDNAKSEPVEFVQAEDIAKLKKRLERRFPSKRETKAA